MKSTMSQNCKEMDREIGNRLRDFRRMAGLSQTEMGTDIGVTFQQIQKYEKGTNRVSLSALVLICRKLGISPMDIIGVYFGTSSPAATLVETAFQTNRTQAAKLSAIQRILTGHDDSALDVGGHGVAKGTEHPAAQVIQ